MYGPGDKQVSVIGRFIKQYRETGHCNIFGDGETLRDFVFVDDAVKIIDQCDNTDDTYNLVTGKSVSLNDLVKTYSMLLTI